MGLKKADLEKLFLKRSAGFSPAFLSELITPTGRGGKYCAEDYKVAICTLSEIIKNNEEDIDTIKEEIQSVNDIKRYVTPCTYFRLQLKNPMLAYRFDEIKPQLQQELFTNDDWLMTEKMNGIRAIVIYANGEFKIFSRNLSDVDCSLLEYSSNVLQTFNSPDGKAFAIDTEIMYQPHIRLTEVLYEEGVSTDSKLEAMTALLHMIPEKAINIQHKYKKQFDRDLITFNLITTLYFKGKSYMKRTLGEAYSVEKEVLDYAKKAGLNIKPIEKLTGSKELKETTVNAWIEQGKEGAVFHNLNSSYNTSRNRDKNGFVKLKRSVGGQHKSKMGDTIDGWVTGFKLGNEGTANENLVSALEVTCYVQKSNGKRVKHKIAVVPNLEKEWKEFYTRIDEEGKPTLAPEIYGMVVEVEGMSISSKSKRLTHPKMIRFRFDKSKDECIYTTEFLLSQIDENSDY